MTSAVTMKRNISIFTLAMLITGSIDSIRNLPATALFGTTLLFFFIFAALLFLLPAGLVSAELSSTPGLAGGIYGWVRSAFGDRVGLLAIWLQWINTMVWYPTILSFIAGTAAYLISPALATNKYYLVGVILGVFWLLTIINLFGIHTSARFASICAVVGMIIPMIVIIGLAIFWLMAGQPRQLHFTAHNILPHFGHAESWISLTAIVTAFLGMELATVHVRDIHQAQHKFPRALFISIVIILITMLCGALAIAFIVPQAKINLVEGVMQVFQHFFSHYHLVWLVPVLAVMLLIGSIGEMVNWVISPARGFAQAGQDGYLPQWLIKKNRHGVVANLLITQAIIVTFVCLAFLLMPTVSGSYWLLTDLSTQLYMLMYVMMFMAAAYLKQRWTQSRPDFAIPGRKLGMCCVCGLGVIGSLVTIIVGFLPPSSINVGGDLHYEVVFISGLIVMLLPVSLFYWYGHVNKNKSAQ